jgi:nitrogen fixation protein FixH
MDDVLVRKLVRQLRWLNIVVTFFGLLIVVMMIIAAVLISRVVSELHKAQTSVTNLQQNTTQQLCNSSAASLLKNYTSTCK